MPDRDGANAGRGDSIALAAFDQARRRLASHHLDDPRRGLPDPVPPSGPPRPRRPAGFGRTDGVGAIGRAVQAQAQGRLEARDLVDEALARAAEDGMRLGGIVDLDEKRAQRDASELDASRRQGEPLRPLHGIVLTVKDVIDVAGMATRAGSDAYHELPDRDASSVVRLRAAGAIILAKTATHEFALGVTTPQSRNPYDPERIPGGSSGGSAIAVACGIGQGSLGTDTRASIRVPAALSGVVGMKGTFGAVPTDGVVSLSWSMDHVAPMAATVDDAALLHDVLVGGGSDLAGFVHTPVAGLRVGRPEACWRDAQPGVAAAVETAMTALEAQGVVVEPCSSPTLDDLEDASAAGLVISRCEAATFHRTLATDLDLCWAEVADQLRQGATVGSTEYLAAQRWRGELRDRLARGFEHHHLLAMPTSPVTAPLRSDFAAFLMILARNAIPWSLIGYPAISVPCGIDDAGLPVGLQLVAPPGREDLLMAAAGAVAAPGLGSPLT